MSNDHYHNEAGEPLMTHQQMVTENSIDEMNDYEDAHYREPGSIAPGEAFCSCCGNQCAGRYLDEETGACPDCQEELTAEWRDR